jgi:FADH2 O2-dependent halogenase
MLVVADRKGNDVYDVAILGTGIGGTTLGAILARHGLNVLLVEEAAHPRFAIGESTVPETTMIFRLLSERYDVPEIRHMASHQETLRNISSSCGVKRNFTFLYHRNGQAQRPDDSVQFNTAARPLGPDIHFFRQDVDAHMLAVAAQYGARVLQRVQVKDVEFHSQGAVLRCADGRELRARFVVDAGGPKALLARQFGLRVDPCPLRTRSRAIYTHMIDVRPYDDCAPRNRHLISPPSQGTLHHIFEGGWFWVIPFNNHPASTNRLVSVGLTLNCDIHGETPAASPEEEFWSIVNRHPSIAAQLQNASPIREWNATGRLQYLSTTSIGERFCAIPHAFAFIDPLFSSGLGLAMNSINAIATRIIAATRTGDYAVERFEFVDRTMKANFHYFDTLVSNSYISFRSPELWSAWVRVWMIGALLGPFAVYELLMHARKSRKPLTDPIFEAFPYRGAQGHEIPEYAALVADTTAVLEAVKAGAIPAADASERIFSIVRESGLWPGPWGKLEGVSSHHAGSYTPIPLLRNGVWLGTKAPAGVRNHLYKAPTLGDAVGFAVQDLREGIALGLGAARRCIRDYIFDYNRDWTQLRTAARQPAPSERPAEEPLAQEPLAHDPLVDVADIVGEGKKTA